jgi:hypothetical protein
MRDDKAVQYLLSDAQTRIREVLKAQVKVFYDVKDSDGRIVVTSSVVSLDEGIAIKDVKRTFTEYRRYLYDTIRDPRDFIRSDLVQLIADAIPTANPKVFEACLNFTCANFDDPKRAYLREFMDEVLFYAFDYIQTRRIKLNDLPYLLQQLKGMYVGSRVNDSKILLQRDLGDRIVRETTVGIRKASVPTAPERTAILLYVVLRTLTMKHYR